MVTSLVVFITLPYFFERALLFVAREVSWEIHVNLVNT